MYQVVEPAPCQDGLGEQPEQGTRGLGECRSESVQGRHSAENGVTRWRQADCGSRAEWVCLGGPDVDGVAPVCPHNVAACQAEQLAAT